MAQKTLFGTGKYCCHKATILVVLSLFVIYVDAQNKCSGLKDNIPHACQHLTLHRPSGVIVTGGSQKNDRCSCRVQPKNSTDQELLLSVSPLHPEIVRRLSTETCNLRVNIFRHTRRRNGTLCPIFDNTYAMNSGNPITIEFTQDTTREQTEYCIGYDIPGAGENDVDIICGNGSVPFEGTAKPGSSDWSILESKAFIIGVSVGAGILLLLIIIIIVITCRRKRRHRDECVMTRYEPNKVSLKDRTSPDNGVTVVPLLQYSSVPEKKNQVPVPSPRTSSLGNNAKDYPIVPKKEEKYNCQLRRYHNTNDNAEIPIILVSPTRDLSDPSNKRMTYLEVDVAQISPGAIKVKVRGAPPKSDHAQIAYK